MVKVDRLKMILSKKLFSAPLEIVPESLCYLVCLWHYTCTGREVVNDQTERTKIVSSGETDKWRRHG